MGGDNQNRYVDREHCLNSAVYCKIVVILKLKKLICLQYTEMSIF